MDINKIVEDIAAKGPSTALLWDNARIMFFTAFDALQLGTPIELILPIAQDTYFNNTNVHADYLIAHYFNLWKQERGL